MCPGLGLGASRFDHGYLGDSNLERRLVKGGGGWHQWAWATATTSRAARRDLGQGVVTRIACAAASGRAWGLVVRSGWLGCGAWPWVLLA